MTDVRRSGQPFERPAFAVLQACLAAAMFTVGDTIAKTLSAQLAVPQILFLSGCFSLLAVSGYTALRHGARGFRPRQPGLVMLRGVCQALAVLCAVSALSHLPIAEAYVILFAAPLAITALSRPLLGERVGARRWAGVLVGFLGIVVMLRPGLSPLGPGQLFALGFVAFYATAALLLRRIGPTEAPSALMVYYFLALVTITGVMQPAVFTAPAAGQLGLILVQASAVTVAQAALIAAFSSAGAGLVAPFQYTQLVWGTLLGYLVFADVPDAVTILGGTVIVGSGLFIWWREQLEARPAARRR